MWKVENEDTSQYNPDAFYTAESYPLTHMLITLMYSTPLIDPKMSISHMLHCVCSSCGGAKIIVTINNLGMGFIMYYEYWLVFLHSK